MLKFHYFLCIAMISLWATVSEAQAAGYGKPQFVTSIKPLALILKDLLREDVADIHVLVSGQESPHHYALKASQMRILRDADWVIWVGPGLENFLQKPIQNLHLPREKMMQLSEFAALTWPSEEDGDHDHANHDHDHAGGRDLHVWLNPENVELIAQALALQLQQILPERAGLIEANLGAYRRQLRQLDQTLRSRFEAYKKRGFLVYHHGYSHFVHRYGLNQLAYVGEVPEEQLSAAKLRQLLDKSAQSSCLLVDVPELPQAERVAKRLGLPVVSIDLLAQAQGPAPEQLNYVRYMLALADDFERCLTLSKATR